MPFFVPDYYPPFPFRNGHLNTIGAYLFRQEQSLLFNRETLETPDGDFLDLDILETSNSKCAILVHGLEGSSKSAYILSLAKLLQRHGWDVVALNLRGCSGESNRLYRAYHSGATDDLKLVVEHVARSYSQIAVIGFSLGGNIVLKYLGDEGLNIPAQIKAAVGVSVPCELSSASDKLEDWQNVVYSKRFLMSLNNKLKEKMTAFSGRLDRYIFESIGTIRQFDDAYTAPANGFKDAEDYYNKCSSLYVLEKIDVPTLLINAQDDPFLTSLCIPWTQAESNDNLHLYAPKYGGHVGFWPERNGQIPKHEEWIGKFLGETNCA